MKNKRLKKRVLELSYKHGLSHISSCLTSIDIIDHIYHRMTNDDRFVLSNGHAGLALYVVLEDKFGLDAEKLFLKHGTHPNRDIKNKIWVSTGSLGHGLPIAVGMALAGHKTYCLISDGECMEGSIIEALRIAWQQHCDLQIYINENGWGAYSRIDCPELESLLTVYPNNIHINSTSMEDYPIEGLQNQDGHYYKLTPEDWNILNEIFE